MFVRNFFKKIMLKNARFSSHFCDVMGEKSAPQATLKSSLEPLESAWSKLSNASRLGLVSCCGVEIRRKDLPKFARFFLIFRDFLRKKTFGQLHHGHLRYRAWYRWKAFRKSFPTVLSSTSNVCVVQKNQWKNRRKSRAFGGGETLFLRGKKGFDCMDSVQTWPGNSWVHENHIRNGEVQKSWK